MNEMTRAPYDEVPLDYNSPSSRFIHFSRDQTGTFHGKLYCYRLDKCPPYLALSYVWGSEESSEIILINGHEITIRRNLWNFLVHVFEDNVQVQPGMEVVSQLLWIDAICIDQTNMSERASQVRLMKDIYQSVSTPRINMLRA
jgi:hypothetical protein